MKCFKITGSDDGCSVLLLERIKFPVHFIYKQITKVLTY